MKYYKTLQQSLRLGAALSPLGVLMTAVYSSSSVDLRSTECFFALGGVLWWIPCAT